MAQVRNVVPDAPAPSCLSSLAAHVGRHIAVFTPRDSRPLCMAAARSREACQSAHMDSTAASDHERFRAGQSRTVLTGLGPLDLVMAYTDVGTGEPVVLLHGIPTWSYLFHDVIPLLEPHCRVVAPDFLGHGYSDRRDRFDRSLVAQTAAVLALLDELGIDQATFIGHDTGGGVALILGVEHPDRVERLVLTNVVAYDSWPIDDMIALSDPRWAEKSRRMWRTSSPLALPTESTTPSGSPTPSGRHRRPLQRPRGANQPDPKRERLEHQPHDGARRPPRADPGPHALGLGRPRPLAAHLGRRTALARDPGGARFSTSKRHTGSPRTHRTNSPTRSSSSCAAPRAPAAEAQTLPVPSGFERMPSASRASRVATRAALFAGS